MRALFRLGKRSDEILDLTAPASEEDGIVAGWLRQSLALSAATPTRLPRDRADEPAT